MTIIMVFMLEAFACCCWVVPTCGWTLRFTNMER